MNTKLFTALSIPLSLLSFNQAIAASPQPQMCPQASAIRAVGVSQNMVDEGNNLWFTGRRNQNYGTASKWTFVMSKIPSTSVNDSYSKAVDALASLSFTVGPVMGPIGKWVCYYRNDRGYSSVAVNPPIATFDAKNIS